jgi:glycosyltransferase involved in cell wall biosynthesis
MVGDPPDPSLDPPLEPYEWLMPLAPWESPEVLAEVLTSLAAQTWPARRLVVSVDGSLPEPLRQVLTAGGLPLCILEAPDWQGTGAVLARGLAACSTRWVLRSDADDCSHPQRAERQLRHLARHPQLVVLGCQLGERLAEGRRVGVRSVPGAAAAIRARLRWRNPFNHPTVALSRPAVLAAGNYRPCPGFEDWDLWLRLAAAGADFANLPDDLVTAAVGAAHLARRRGGAYAQREATFLCRCGREGLLPWAQVLLLLLLRLPLRLLPPAWLAAVMRCLRSTRGAGTE